MTMMLRMQSCYGVQSNLFLLSWSPLLSEMIIVYPSLYALRLDLILSNLSARQCSTSNDQKPFFTFINSRIIEVLVRVNLVILLLSMFGLLLTAPGLERGTR